MAKKPQRGARNRDANPRKFKKKTSPLVIEKVEYVDYKDVDLLTRFMSDRGKIRGKHLSGNDVQQQREVANAIKIAREMGLLPYARRVASAGRQGRGRDGDRRGRPADVDARDTSTAPVEETNLEKDDVMADDQVEVAAVGAESEEV